MATPAASHSISHTESSGIDSYFHYLPCTGIPNRSLCEQLLLHRSMSSREPFRASLLKNLLGQLGSFTRLS